MSKGEYHKSIIEILLLSVYTQIIEVDSFQDPKQAHWWTYESVVEFQVDRFLLWEWREEQGIK